MNDTLYTLYNTVTQRRGQPEEGSYTCYLFEKGLDKILKKCGEECTEVIIAAKGDDKTELTGEICDLIYHIIVLAVEKDVALEDITGELDERAKKIKNKKNMRDTDRNT